jgi:hypothetical protein
MFDDWASGSGVCPYSLPVERKHFFSESKIHYNPKAERINDRDLILMICKEKNWKIKIDF